MAEQTSMYVCPNCKTRIPFGTEDQPPPRRCPGCHRRLYIPTVLRRSSVVQLACPICSKNFTALVSWNQRPLDKAACPKCGFVIALPIDPPAEPQGATPDPAPDPS